MWLPGCLITAELHEVQPSRLHNVVIGLEGRSWQKVYTIPFMALHAADKVDVVSKQVAECLGGKGGGRSGRYQGKAPGITQAQVQDAVERMSLVTAAR